MALGAALTVSDAILDGAIVHLGPDAAPLFYDLMRRRTPQHFMAFRLNPGSRSSVSKSVFRR